jgi:hypothetical protein
VKRFIWQTCYEAAVFETNPTLIESRIASAEKAILDRLEDELARFPRRATHRLSWRNIPITLKWAGIRA